MMLSCGHIENFHSLKIEPKNSNRTSKLKEVEGEGIGRQSRSVWDPSSAPADFPKIEFQKCCVM